MAKDILIVDDEEDIRSLIQGILEDEGYETREAASSQAAEQALQTKRPDLIILDIWLQGSKKDGLELLETIKAEYPDIPVVMISGHGTIETAVSAIKQGAYDFIEKPFKSDRLLLMLERALETADLRRQNRILRHKTLGSVDMIGNSQAMQTLRQSLNRIAQTNSRVLITGEAGCGKEVTARMLHKLSGRSAGPFIALNCANLHPERLEAELFGSEENGETYIGVLEQADGGTLFLDEVADMPLVTQGKILHLMQENQIQRLGGKDKINIDVRIMSSTNKDLEDAVKNGNFREDLFYRMNVVPLKVPPLRERLQDIPLLADYFVDQYARQSGASPKKISEDALLTLQRQPWPGNVRQLRNVIEWVMIMLPEESDTIKSSNLPADLTGQRSEAANQGGQYSEMMVLPLREAREAFERDYLKAQITRFQGNISKTAQFVGMERSALHRKMKSLDISCGEKQDNDETGDRKRA